MSTGSSSASRKPKPKGKQPQRAGTDAPPPPQPHAVAGSENEPWVVNRPVNRTWIEYNAQDAGTVRSKVRKHAATASAAARKATIARKEAARRAVRRAGTSGQMQVVVHGRAVPTSSAHAGTEEAALDVLRRIGGDSAAVAGRVGKDGEGLVQLLDFVTALQQGRDWYSGGLKGTTLARKAVSTMLWDSYANIDTLFQAALFISGTHSNSCGLPPTVTAHQGSGLLMLRGASLKAVEAAVMASDTESSTPIAIALLAGWERRFGDEQSYAVHMGAWRQLQLPQKALEDNSVSTLTDVTLEIFRERLDERSFISPGEIRVRQHPEATCQRDLASLPPGFKVFRTGRPEVRSLLMLMVAMAQHPADKPSTIPARRKLGMEIIAWNPTHTRSCEAVPEIEALYDQQELMALYHLRAALISINGVLLQLCLDNLGIKSLFNMQLGLDVHCMSCQHLNTESLLPTKYREIAFWSRYILCSISRDPDRDEYLRYLMRVLDLDSWDKVRTMLERHVDLEPAFGWPCWNLYQTLTAGSRRPAGFVSEVVEVEVGRKRI
jgi:hypothetical protein